MARHTKAELTSVISSRVTDPDSKEEAQFRSLVARITPEPDRRLALIWPITQTWLHAPTSAFVLRSGIGPPHNLNTLADGGPAGFDDITRAINGGLTNKADRDQYYATALRVLGAHQY